MAEIEVRTIPGAVRAASGANPKLVGTAVTYGALSHDLGGFREKFAAGALDDQVRNKDLRVIYQHDRSYVFGRVGAGTARFWIEDGKVMYEATPPNAQWARDAMESIDRGDIYQSSFAFRVPEGGDSYERKGDTIIRTVLRAELIEAGPQTTPAYETTSTSVRSRVQELGGSVSSGVTDAWRFAAVRQVGTEIEMDRARSDARAETAWELRRRSSGSRFTSKGKTTAELRAHVDRLERENVQPQKRDGATRFTASVWGREGRATAVHEASHALIASALGCRVSSIAVISADSGSCHHSKPRNDADAARIHLAGPVAEALFLSRSIDDPALSSTLRCAWQGDFDRANARTLGGMREAYEPALRDTERSVRHLWFAIEYVADALVSEPGGVLRGPKLDRLLREALA